MPVRHSRCRGVTALIDELLAEQLWVPGTASVTVPDPTRLHCLPTALHYHPVIEKFTDMRVAIACPIMR
jgi:hypothetical protein